MKKQMSDVLGLELGMTVSNSMVLGIKPRSSTKAIRVLNCRAISLDLQRHRVLRQVPRRSGYQDGTLCARERLEERLRTWRKQCRRKCSDVAVL